MNTAELAKEVGVHPWTIRTMVHRQEIDFTPVGGRTGYLFDRATAPQAVREILKMRHVERVAARRKSTAKARRAS